MSSISNMRYLVDSWFVFKALSIYDTAFCIRIPIAITFVLTLFLCEFPFIFALEQKIQTVNAMWTLLILYSGDDS
jgi:hypothetical protein